MRRSCAAVWRTRILSGIKAERCYVDRGYRGHGVTETEVFISEHKRGVTRTIKRELKRRSAIEREIGHMKNDGHLGRCYLKGQLGDAMNALLVACGHNLRKVLYGLRAFFARILVLLCLAKYPFIGMPQCNICHAA